jgi:uncharacterized protein
MLNDNSLILFTRYPTPGQTKTRMIPALGPQGAADLQAWLTGWMLLNARAWAASRKAALHVRTTGATKADFGRWLGRDALLVDQGAGDLGHRMAHAVNDAFHQGAKRVLIVGIDCPDIDPTYLDDAVTALDKHDAVVGPAHDGGYVLIGLRRPLPSLFSGPTWGTNTVLEQTRSIAAREGIHLAELEPRSDIDEPGDLAVLKGRYPPPRSPSTISVIIPAYQEEDRIEASLRSAMSGADEIIVADGGSTDHTVEKATACGAKVIHAPRGRAAQMNAGALAATGDRLVFLHADTLLPPGWADAVRSGPEAGAFTFSIAEPGTRYRQVEWGVRQRCRWFSLPYGDQALFITRDLFIRMGGYAMQPIMEDVDLVRRVKAQVPVTTLDLTVYTSSRRWQRHGWLTTTLIHQLLLTGSLIGVPYSTLSRLYRRFSSSPH